MNYRIISIGALSRHDLWQETAATRTPHATTVLIRSEKRVILVDPGLPPQVIAARLHERSGLKPEQVTDVFLTCFRPAHRQGLAAFTEAKWWISEAEREIVGNLLVSRLKEVEDEQAQAPAGADDGDIANALKQDIAILQRCQPAADQLAKQVDLFPLPGFTPGTCGLLLLEAATTTLVAGDAVASMEHLEQGQVLRGCYNLEQARESLTEAIEIADTIIPGHDNVIFNPTRRRATPHMG